ncbi:hypothetical protein J6590_105303, partial [Homalodisca vitripennis]
MVRYVSQSGGSHRSIIVVLPNHLSSTSLSLSADDHRGQSPRLWEVCRTIPLFAYPDRHAPGTLRVRYAVTEEPVVYWATTAPAGGLGLQTKPRHSSSTLPRNLFTTTLLKMCLTQKFTSELT